MASSNGPSMSPFSKAVVRAVEKLYPTQLADKSFDNTGLLLEAPSRPGLKNSVLLTVDLTKSVAAEAIASKVSIIVTYHPIIFRGLKSLTLGNTQQSSLLRLAQEGISVYSPHTAVDATPDALNDYLADFVTEEFTGVQHEGEFKYAQKSHPHDRSVITPVKEPPAGFEGAGHGKIVRFHKPQKLGDILGRITHPKCGLGVTALSVAVPQAVPKKERPNIEISSVGVCAGSGSSVLSGVDVDLLFTGELSHHEALAAIEQGKCVITTFHSNTERDFLKRRLHWDLMRGIEDELKSLEEKAEWTSGEDFTVLDSEVDADPYTVFTTKEHPSW